MIIDRIESLDKRRSKVFIDGDFAFVLYNGELYRYRLTEGCELEKPVYETLLWQVVGRRAREKAISLLKLQGRTEYEMTAKLKAAFFPETVITETMRFLKEYRYLDDEAYAKNYLEIHGKRKSRAELERDLMKKGLDRSLVRRLCREQEAGADSRRVIAVLMKKRGYKEDAPLKERQKTIAYLMRRGFSWEEICAASVFLTETEEL